MKHCLLCGGSFNPNTPTHKFCSAHCARAFRQKQKHAGGTSVRFCRQCGTAFRIESRADANRQHCSSECSIKSARESRSKFYRDKPEKIAEYHARSREKRGPDSNLKRFYARYPEAPRACEVCGEVRVLDVAHKPGHERRGAWRSKENTTIEKVWILCPTCHALLDRMHYSPLELGLMVGGDAICQ